jgi:hypothetical protein
LVEKAEGKRPLENQDVGGWIVLKWALERHCEVLWSGLIWLRIRTSGGHLWIFGFHKILENYWAAAQLTVYQEGLIFMKLVTCGHTISFPNIRFALDEFSFICTLTS